MVLGRTHIKDVAAKRKIELNSYLQSLMNASTDVAEVTLLNENNILYLLCYIIFKLMNCFLFILSVILFVLSSTLYFAMRKLKE